MNGIGVCVCVPCEERRLLLIKHGTYSHVDLTLQACHYANENTYSDPRRIRVPAGYPLHEGGREGGK